MEVRVTGGEANDQLERCGKEERVSQELNTSIAREEWHNRKSRVGQSKNVYLKPRMISSLLKFYLRSSLELVFTSPFLLFFLFSFSFPLFFAFFHPSFLFNFLLKKIKNKVLLCSPGWP